MHYAIGFSLFQDIYGKTPPSIPAYIVGSSSVATCDSTRISHDEDFTLFRINFLKVQNHMKKWVDQHRREVDLPVESWAYVKLWPYRQTSLFGAKYHKLAKHFYGPYLILSKISLVAYKLDLPSTSKIHNDFHCSALRPRMGPPPSPFVINHIPPLPHLCNNAPIITPLTIA